MAKGTGGGAATKPSGPAIRPKGSATRGFVPPGAAKASGPAIRQKVPLKPVGKTGYDVQK